MVIVVLVWIVIVGCDFSQSILKLHGLVESAYNTKSTNFSMLPPQWSEKEGLYKSNIHFNFIGGQVETNLRRTFRIPDSNMFVTNFVVIGLLEMYELYPELSVDKERLLGSLKGMNWFQDNMFEKGTPIYRFWPTMEKDGVWMSYPVNLWKPMQYFPDAVTFLDWIFKLLGLKGWEKWIDDLAQVFEHIVFAFHIPADIDDSFCNLALGGLLSRLNDDFPEANKYFEQTNTKLKFLFDQVESVSWRPFLEEKSDVRKIDPRTYMFAHDFLDEISGKTNKYTSSLMEQAKNEFPNTILPGTWILSENETRKYYGKESMPFNVNNIDANVITNFLFGLTYFLLYHPESETIVTPTVRNIYTSVSAYVEWCAKSKMIEKRPDIGLTYYPSLYDYYWFVTRITFLLNNFNGTLPLEEMNSVRDSFVNLTRNEITDMILSSGNRSVIGYVYWDDFLGDQKGKPKLGEDRIFSTGLAVNALIDTWTIKSSSSSSSSDNTKKKGRIWIDETPKDVKMSVFEGLEYINENIFGEDALVENAFFSGSTRSVETLPFFYPANYYNYVNGSNLPTKEWPPQNTKYLTDDLIIAMDGYVEKEEYEKWMDMKFFGEVPPKEDTGYDSAFPFWSSPALTYSVAMTAMVKYDVIQNH